MHPETVIAINAARRSRFATDVADGAVTTAQVALQAAQDALRAAQKALAKAEATAKQKGPQGDSGADGKDGADGHDGRGIAVVSGEAGGIRIEFDDDSVSRLDWPAFPDPVPGDPGRDGRGIESVEIKKRNLFVTYTDGVVEDCGEVIPPQTEIRRNKKGDSAMVMRLRDGGPVPSQSQLYQAEATATDITLLESRNYVVDVDCSAGDVTVTLPDAATTKNYSYHIKKTDSTANVVNIVPVAGQIDGDTSAVISQQYTNILAVSNGVDYLIR